MWYLTSCHCHFGCTSFLFLSLSMRSTCLDFNFSSFLHHHSLIYWIKQFYFFTLWRMEKKRWGLPMHKCNYGMIDTNDASFITFFIQSDEYHWSLSLVLPIWHLLINPLMHAIITFSRFLINIKFINARNDFFLSYFYFELYW